MPRKLIAKTLAKQVTARPAVSASTAPDKANTILTAVDDSSAARSIVCSVSHSETKPFKGGSAAIASTPMRNRRGGPRHAADQAAEPVHVGGADPGVDDAGTREQQRLVERVIDQVIEPGDQRDARDHAVTGGREDQPGAERGDDDPHVLDRAVGERPAQVGLDGRVQDADQGGQAADDQRDEARPERDRRQEIGIDPQDRVDAEIGRRARRAPA